MREGVENSVEKVEVPVENRGGCRAKRAVEMVRKSPETVEIRRFRG